MAPNNGERNPKSRNKRSELTRENAVTHLGIPRGRISNREDLSRNLRRSDLQRQNAINNGGSTAIQGGPTATQGDSTATH